MAVQEQSLKTVCDFFCVELGVEPERSVSLWDPHTWFNWVSSADLEQLWLKVKRTVMKKAYSWLSDVLIAQVDKLDEELTSLDTVIRELYNGLSSPRHFKEGYTLPMYWEFTAKMKNEILRTFCRWATAVAKQRRNAKDDQITKKFITEMEPLQKNFIRAVTEVQTDKNMAIVFLDEFWMCISQKTKQQMVASTVSAVAQRFVDPSAFLTDCDTCYIQQFGKPGGKAPERVFQYIVNPVEEMKLHAEGCIQNLLQKEETRAKTEWTTTMNDIRDAFVDLCKKLRVKIRDPSLSCAVEDDIKEEPEEVRKKNFITFVEFVNASSVPFRIVNDTKHVSTGTRTSGEDDAKFALSITQVDTITSLEAFLCAMISGLEAHKLDEIFIGDMAEDRAAITGRWIGCLAQCPYCKKKCSLAKHDSKVQHVCSFHQPLGFGGTKIKANNKPLFITCDELDNQGRTYFVPGKQSVLRFSDHVRQCHDDWHVTVGGDSGMSAFLEMQGGYQNVWADNTFNDLICKHWKLECTTWEEGVKLAKHPFLTKIQVALVLDTTESMSREIEQCREDCVNMVESVSATAANQLGNQVTVEFAFCSYKDIGDEGHLQHTDFQGPLGYEQVKSQISAQVASGGGDFPEDILGAFRKVYNFSWADQSNTQVRRIMILIADAPCHGGDYTDQHDDHPEDGIHMPGVLKELTDRKINCCFSVIHEVYTEKMQLAFQKHWEEHGGKDCTFRTFPCRREAGDEILQNVVDVIQTLIQGSV